MQRLPGWSAGSLRLFSTCLVRQAIRIGVGHRGAHCTGDLILELIALHGFLCVAQAPHGAQPQLQRRGMERGRPMRRPKMPTSRTRDSPTY